MKKRESAVQTLFSETDCHTSDIGHWFANIHVGLDTTKNISVYAL